MHKGFPIVGDLKYGDSNYNKEQQIKGLNRMLLHAESINFYNMGIEQSSPIPDIFKICLEEIKTIKFKRGCVPYKNESHL